MMYAPVVCLVAPAEAGRPIGHGEPSMPLLGFDKLIDSARWHMSEAQSWVRSDWSDEPSERQIVAFHAAMGHLSDAKDLIDEARAKPHLGER